MKKIVAALLFLFAAGILILLLWSTGFFYQDPGVPVVPGLNKIRPNSSSIYYRTDGRFEAAFQNKVPLDTNIVIDKLSMKEVISDTNCSLMSIGGQEGLPLSVEKDALFQITAQCPQKEEEESFELSVTISYRAVMHGVDTRHLETGHLRGPVEE